MISPKRPINVEFRILTQPFTENVAKDGERLHILGGFNHSEERKNLGEDLVKSYVKTMFCAKLHNVSSERIPMQKKILILFPSKKEKMISKQHAVAKERESILNVLAAGLVKTSPGDVEWSKQLQNLQRSRFACRCKEHTFHANKQKGPSSILG